MGGVVVDLGQVVFQPEHGVDGTCRASSVPRFLCLQPVHKPRLILPVVRQIAVKDAPHLVFRVPPERKKKDTREERRLCGQ